MLNLTNAGTDKLQLTMSVAGTLDVHASWVDLNAGAVTPGRTNTACTSGTTDIVATPGSSTYRNVKTINIRNKHASTSVDVTIIFDQNGTDFELFKATVRSGECLEYIEGVGWFVVYAPSSPSLRTMRLASDQSNSTTTPTEVTGVSLTTGTGTFAFQYNIFYTSSASSVGVRFSVNHTGTVGLFAGQYRWVDTSATASTASTDQDAVGAAGQALGGMAARAKSTAGWGTTIGVDAGGTGGATNLMIMEGSFIVTVDGDIELWHGSESAFSTTVQAGTSLLLWRTGD